MSTFNKYDYLETLANSIKEERPDDMWDFINQDIDRECIYYYNCFEIIRELNFTDWEDNQFGQVNTISQLAFIALYEFVIDNLEVEYEVADSLNEEEVLTDKKAFSEFAQTVNTNLKNIIK
jgi:hypothetical protein